MASLNHSFREVAQFLKQNETNYLREWEEAVFIDQDDIHKDKIRYNGYLMFSLVIKSLIDIVEEENIKQLAYKVAQERVEANINIGEFSYNVNLGRSIIIKYVTQSGIVLSDLPTVVDTINQMFNIFGYHAVSRYTELKNKELEEKNLFISQTHNDRLALLGQMSSSFVHEFRNPLTSVMGFIKLLKNEYPNLKYIDIIAPELDQLKFRITQFLHTSKMNITTDESIEKLSLKNLLGEIIEFLYPSIVDRDVNIIEDIDDSIIIEVNKSELKQVFLNILMNSIDAVTQNIGKKEVIVSCQTFNEHNIIKLANNGPAIPQEVIKTIFEPFYTTKKLGTGIGLYVCKNIVEKYHGTITCSSNELLTSFEITLPYQSVTKPTQPLYEKNGTFQQ